MSLAPNVIMVPSSIDFQIGSRKRIDGAFIYILLCSKHINVVS